MDHYAIAVFRPETYDTSWVVQYYCCYSYGSPTPSESLWAVPGTLDLLED